MGSPINWGIHPQSPLLQNQYYLLYSQQTIGNLNATQIKTALKACYASNESMELIAYLSTLLRILALVS
jgi:hypothetical protein